MLLAKAIAICYLLFGLVGLAVVSIPSNYHDMFHEPGRPFVGLGRLAHAYVVLIFMVACGASAWLFPTHTAALAIAVFATLVLGKATSIINGLKVRCPHCLIGGIVVASLLTWALVAGSSQVVAP